MKKILLITFILVAAACTDTAFAQKSGNNNTLSVDSVFSRLRSVYSGVKKEKFDRFHLPEKCGTWMHLFIKEHWKELSPLQQQEYNVWVSPLKYDSSIVVGRFKVNYFTGGANEATMIDEYGNTIPGSAREYAESVASAANYAWEIEIDSLGYQPPIVTIVSINVEDLTHLYGFTSNNTITIDNDFLPSEYPTHGLEAVKVTVAHELHHMIQFQYNQSAPRFYMEMTSVWMEDVVYNNVNDYIYYLYLPGGCLGSPDASFETQNGLYEYSRGIWGKFIEESFKKKFGTKDSGRAVMKRSWENIGNGMDAMHAIDNALQSVGSTFTDAFSEFSYWNLFIGKNTADTVNYYPEGRTYYWYENIAPGEDIRRDRVRFEPVRSVGTGSIKFRDSLEYLSCKYYRFEFGSDTVITNIIRAGIDSTAELIPFRYSIQSQAGDTSYYSLPNQYSAKLEIRTPSRYVKADDTWRTHEVITRQVLEEDLLVYPNPFVFDGSNTLKIQVPPNISGKLSLNIFGIDLSSVYSASNVQSVPDFRAGVGYGNRVIEWNGKTDTNGIPSSGVYFYYLSTDDKNWKGKFAFIRK